MLRYHDTVVRDAPAPPSSASSRTDARSLPASEVRRPESRDSGSSASSTVKSASSRLDSPKTDRRWPGPNVQSPRSCTSANDGRFWPVASPATRSYQVRRPVTSHDPPPGAAPSTTTLASVRLAAADPPTASRPARLSTISSDDSRSPQAAPKPPAANSNRSTVSGLKAPTRPNSRYGLWISTPSITVRFWSGVPPRTASRLLKSPVAATPGSRFNVRKTLSTAPATASTCPASTGVAEGRSRAGRGETTSTVSANVFRNSSTSSAGRGAGAAGSTAAAASR